MCLVSRSRHNTPTCREAGVIMRVYGTLGLLLQKNVAELCNGSTYDSDSYCLGSNPSSAAKEKAPHFGAFCYAVKKCPILGLFRTLVFLVL